MEPMMGVVGRTRCQSADLSAVGAAREFTRMYRGSDEVGSGCNKRSQIWLGDFFKRLGRGAR